MLTGVDGAAAADGAGVGGAAAADGAGEGGAAAADGAGEGGAAAADGAGEGGAAAADGAGVGGATVDARAGVSSSSPLQAASSAARDKTAAHVADDRIKRSTLIALPVTSPLRIARAANETAYREHTPRRSRQRMASARRCRAPPV